MTLDLDPKAFMRRAIELSRIHMEAGEGGPFGAVVVRDGLIVAEGWNRVTSTQDPTAHAEVVAIREACARLGTFELKGYREVALPISDRSLPTRNLLRDEALTVFQAWDAKPDKVRY